MPDANARSAGASAPSGFQTVWGHTPTVKNAAQSGQLDSIISGMNAGDADKFRKVLSDPNAANRMLSSPQAQKLLQMLSNPPKGGK